MKALLLDADGVIQTTRADFLPRLKSVLDKHSDKADEFIADIFTAEKPCLSGAADFEEELRTVLQRWSVRRPVEEVLMLWDSITIVPGIPDLISTIRRSGVLCCLATNQQHKRAAFMRSTLDYDNLFDRQYYSYEMGLVKPSTDYFMKILLDTGLSPQDVLFVDDNAPNVHAAQSLGINGLVFNLAEYADPCNELSDQLQQFDL